MVARHKIFILSGLLFLFVFSTNQLKAQTLFQQVGIASSPNPVGSGARAVGMGGAFIGVADDATAASWNPAGLIQLERPEMSVVGEYFYRKEEFSSDDRPEIKNTGTVDGSDLNYLSATYPFHFYKNIVVSMNYQKLYDFKRDFSHRLDFSSVGLDLVQKRSFDQDGYLGAFGIACAVEITPKLSFGVTFNIWPGDLIWDNGWDEKFTERGVGTLAGNPVTIDTKVTDKYSDFTGFNANIGLLWDISKHFTFGAVVKTPFTAKADHTFNFIQVQTFGPPLNTTITSQQKVTENVDIDIPLSYGFGLAYRASDTLTFDLDVYRTDWSDFTITDSQGNKFSPIDGRPASKSHVEATTQVRLGGEYLFILEAKEIVVPVRAGVFYDPEPAEDGVKDFFGFSVGSGIVYKWFIFDVAYQFRWGNDVDTGNLIATSEADVYQHKILASVITHF